MADVVGGPLDETLLEDEMRTKQFVLYGASILLVWFVFYACNTFRWGVCP